MAMTKKRPLPYVPFNPWQPRPSKHINPVSWELLLLFLDAVARVTKAFVQLRDEILPLCTSPTKGPVKEIAAWLARWHLNSFEDLELNDRIHAWAFEVLDYWKSNSHAADKLRIDCGWVAHRPAPRPPPPIRYDPYDDRRESPAAYKKRMVGAWRKVLAEEIARADVERKGQNPPPARRDRGRDPRQDFEWLALFLCKGLSDAEIAQLCKKGESAGMVKKARQRLYDQGFQPAGT